MDEDDSALKEVIQAHTYNMNFASKRKGVQVFSAEDQILNQSTILKEYENPDELKLHKGEDQILFIDPLDRTKIKCFDFQKEKIVEEWEADGNSKIVTMDNLFKNAQSSQESTIYCCSSKGVFLLDPRISKKQKAVKSKVYKANYLFSKMASTVNNQFVIGSKKGELRLYEGEVGKRAKTLLTGLGEEIIGLDVSHDGNYIVATCPDFLMLIPTQFKGDRNGFTSQMGQEKPKPRKLTLSNPDYVRLGVQNAKYTKATFNNGSTNHDSEIITSIGNYIITWRLKDIKKGRLGQYETKKKDQKIV